MFKTITEKSITQYVLDQPSGEIKPQDVRVTDIMVETIKGGFTMIYKEYGDIMEKVIKSNLDIKLFLWITKQFTYRNIEVNISYSNCNIKVSQPTFAKLIKKLQEEKYIMRIRRGVYRLNPFIYLPYKSEGLLLQKEWIELENHKKKMKRSRCVDL